MIGFGHHDMIHLLKGGDKHIFVDCTFSCTPPPFKQVMIIMIYEPATELYLPVFHILLQSKKTTTYRRAFVNCIWACDYKFNAISFSSDFEKAIMESIKLEFDNPTIIGCLFHWKQAIRRKMLDYNIPKDKISFLMRSDGLLEMLTVIPISEIECKGIPYIRANCIEGEDSGKFDRFWIYFCNTWMATFPPDDWNIHGKFKGQR